MKKPSFLMNRALLSAVLAALTGPAVALAAVPTELHVTLRDFKVELDRTHIPAGPVKLRITNADATEHEAVLEFAGADNKPLKANRRTSEVEDIDPGQSATLAWTLDQPGQYQLACHVPGHYEEGMVATFTVDAIP
jgi:plastocyanin